MNRQLSRGVPSEIDEEFILCPSCGQALRRAAGLCENCGRTWAPEELAQEEED